LELASGLLISGRLNSMGLSRTIGAFVLLCGILLQAGRAATLSKLSLDEMTQRSTAIVRARVLGSSAAAHGNLIYTHYRLQASERWKGTAATELDVVVPGGVAGGFRQTFAGAPHLTEGSEYVFFLWTSQAGLTHIIGLSQGLLNLQTDQTGELTAVRGASGEVMLDGTGKTVRDEPFSMRLTDLRTRVGSTLAQGARK
jgi:hypothetical protein